MFQFSGLPLPGLCVQPGVSGLVTQDGFPHSDIPGSALASSSPRHFAGSRVLHRRLVPRHPPWTLSSLSTYVHSSDVDVMGFRGSMKLPSAIRKDSLRLFDLFGCQGTGGDERIRTADPLLAKRAQRRSGRSVIVQGPIRQGHRSIVKVNERVRTRDRRAMDECQTRAVRTHDPPPWRRALWRPQHYQDGLAGLPRAVVNQSGCSDGLRGPGRSAPNRGAR
jgi:hypothetical protein